MIFKNRVEAGTLLSAELTSFHAPQTIVFGLARGGVIVASEVSRLLSVPLDVLTVKKLASRMDPELAIGALAPDHISYIDWKLAHRLGIDEDTVNRQLIPDVEKLIDQRSILYHRRRKKMEIKGKAVILVDDGAATGATFRAAIAWTKKKKAGAVIVAVPVSPPDFVREVSPEVQKLIVLSTPDDFRSVGQFYENFPQVTDEEVVELLNRNSSLK